MKHKALVAVAVLALSAVLLPASSADAGSRGRGGGFYLSTSGIAVNAGWPGGVSFLVAGGWPGYYYGRGHGPRRGYPGHPGHRPLRYGPGYYPDPFVPYYRYDPRWGRPYYDGRRHDPPARKWKSRTWIPGRMTSGGFAPGYWAEGPLAP